MKAIHLMDQKKTHPDVTQDLSFIIEQVEARSGAAFHQSAPPAYAAKLGIETATIEAATLLSTRKSNNLYFNRVLGLGLTIPATIEQLEKIVVHYTERKIKQFAVALSPLAQPNEITSWLIERGFQDVGGPAKLWRGDLRPENVETDFRIERIGAKRASEWFTVMSTVFHQFRSRREWYEARVDADGWHHYLAYDGAEPAAISALYVQDGAAHLTDAATLSKFRRRGVQRAMIHRRIVDSIVVF